MKHVTDPADVAFLKELLKPLEDAGITDATTAGAAWPKV